MNNRDFFKHFAGRQALPDSFVTRTAPAYERIAMAVRRASIGTPLLIGISGSQGTGKSTLSVFIRDWLRQHSSLRVASLSLDDCYLTRAQRETLARTVHPLLITRGPPGTHDLALLRNTLTSLLDPDFSANVTLPRFNKALDERLAPEDSPVCEQAPDIVLFDGWLLGCAPVSEARLASPCNALEQHEDSTGQWRRYTNAQLQHYQALWRSIDLFIGLRAPSFEHTQQWRFDAEQRLMLEGGQDRRHRNIAEIRRFTQHFQRFSARLQRSMNTLSDIDVELDADHCVTSVRLPDS
ncbi:MAG: kinase [Pseudomonadota bacterium]